MAHDKTAPKQSEEALRESEERSRIVIQTASDAILTIDEESTILFANPAVKHIFGYSPDELVGQHLMMLMPEYLRHLHEAGMRRYVETGQRHISWEAVELPGLRRDGREISLEISFGEFMRDGKHVFTGIARDITERKRAELRQTTQHAVTRVLSESATLGEAVSKILETICEKLDWSLGALWRVDRYLGVLRCVEVWHAPGMQLAEFETSSKQQALPLGVGLPGRVWQSGSPLWVADVTKDANFPRAASAVEEGLSGAFAFPIQIGGEVVGVMEFFSREIRQPDQALLDMMLTIGSQTGQFIERQRVEEERACLLVREQEAREEAERANRLKDEFLSTLSHELRTPLTSIYGWAHLLRSADISPSVSARALEAIERNAHAQTKLIDDLLDISRIITGKLRLDIQVVNLAAIIEAAVDAARPAAQAKGIRLQMLVDPKASPISGDADRLQQIIWNLLTNAIKFTPKGGRVQVRLERVDSHLEVIVSDTGKGISADFLPHVFDRFRQADGTTTRAHGGLGLSLSIVRQLVEMHGGAVKVESDGEGQGAIFIVELPLMLTRRESDKSRRHPTAGSDESAAYECPPALDGLRILVVDDEADTREVLYAVLERCKAEVVTAGSAVEALETFGRLKPDILISDIGMPEEDGYSLIGKVRALEADAKNRTPAVALTAYARVDDRVRALNAGFQVHITKPIEPVELIAVIASLTGRTAGK